MLLGRRLAVVSVGLCALVSSAWGADPAWYQKRDTWQATVLASREAQMAAQAAAGPQRKFAPFKSDVRRGGMPPLAVKVDVSQVETLWLSATIGPDNYNYDQATWGEPTLYDQDGKATKLSELKPTTIKVGFGELLVNSNHTGAGLSVAGKKFKYGFWAHAPSQLSFALDRKYVRFEAQVGIDTAAGANGSSEFIVSDKPTNGGDIASGGLWQLVARDFPGVETAQLQSWEQADSIWAADWKAGDRAALAQRYAAASRRVASLGAQAAALVPAVTDEAGLDRVRQLYYRAHRLDADLALAKTIQTAPLRRAIDDLTHTFGARYPQGGAFSARLTKIEQELPAALDAVAGGKLEAGERAAELAADFRQLQRQALLANPLLDFDKLLVVKRGLNQLGLPANWQSNSSLPRTGYDNELATLSLRDLDAPLTTLYKPAGGRFVGDLKLHWNADRLLFSSIGANGRWQVFEYALGTQAARQVTPGDEPDVDNYDACYLPDGQVLFTSTAPFQGVPCVFGSDHVATLFRMDAEGKHVRQLCFEQEHDWYPSVMANGRVMYARWEYTDTPHSNTRLLFTMNPDGTEQMAYLGSNSYWPNSFFYAKPIPGSPTKVVSVISGHHGSQRAGELVVFDPTRGRFEEEPAVQRIPGFGKKVERVIKDQLTDGSWPKFLHPWPLSENYFLVSAKLDAHTPWGLYLVDTFDNLLLLRREAGYALLEPVPLKVTPTPPVVPDKVDTKRNDALVYIQDIYSGPGLRGVPKGEVKALRLFGYEFSFHGMGGLLGVLGMDGPWDIKRIMGTVPVEPDGSAYFRIPANTPVSLQPLDQEGKAMQLMRSWFTGMPGELVSCVGCHDQQNTTPKSAKASALRRDPSEIRPWYGPTRGFSFVREVQPVLDRYCVGCHDGGAGASTAATGGTKLVDFSAGKKITDWAIIHPGNGGHNGGRFTVGYAELCRYVRRPGIESDYHLLTPMEFHSDTTELVQMLKRGHHGVQLDAESWDRLLTWIDLNTVYHGTWLDAGHNPGKQRERRRDLLFKYAGVAEDPEAEAGGKPAVLQAPALPARVVPAALEEVAKVAPPAGWPFDAAAAKARQAAAGAETTRTLDLGDGVKLELVLIPAGEFVMGGAGRVKVDRPYWLGRCELSNAQYARFDPAHDSRIESKLGYQFGIHGYPLNQPQQPVVRVTWREANAFCDWLSKLTGTRAMLPTEAQWEWACRAGSATPFWFGDLSTDFGKLANFGDAKLKELSSNPYTLDQPLANPGKYDDWVPKETRFNDGSLVSAPIGSYAPNPWGLCDMHGNVAEWTRTNFASYPYREDDGRNDGSLTADKVVRGGSWRDRPFRCTSDFRLAYRTYEPVFNVGFRVLLEAAPGGSGTRVAAR